MSVSHWILWRSMSPICLECTTVHHQLCVHYLPENLMAECIHWSLGCNVWTISMCGGRLITYMRLSDSKVINYCPISCLCRHGHNITPYIASQIAELLTWLLTNCQPNIHSWYAFDLRWSSSCVQNVIHGPKLFNFNFFLLNLWVFWIIEFMTLHEY